MDKHEPRTVLDGKERIGNHITLNNKAVSVNANGIEELKVMDNESFCEEEATLFDVK